MTLSNPDYINPTIRLRNELLEVGHDVRYVIDSCDSNEEDLYSERGLPVVRLVHLPDGSVSIPVFAPAPDVVLLEASLVPQAILGWYYEVPTLKLSTTFSQRYDAKLPPITSDVVPHPSEDLDERVGRAWRTEHEQRSRLSAERAEHGLRVARALGFPKHWLDERAALDLTFRLPELDLAPAELDFERADEDIFYAGPCVDLARDESGCAPMTGLPPDRAIVYCSFGTQAHCSPNLVERLRVIVETARLLSDVHFLLSWHGEALHDLPSNFVTMRNAPQLSLLRRASLLLSQGGLSSINEALCLGVPPVTLPLERDQPGNAARLVYHGCGLKGSWDMSPAELAVVVRGALNDELLGRRVRGLSDRLRHALAARQAASAFARCLDRTLEFRKQSVKRVMSLLV